MMSSFQVVGSSPTSGIGVMETSNFAHVIFQNVRKSFLPQEALECCYTLTSYITPNPKDWVGIFKVTQTHTFYITPHSKDWWASLRYTLPYLQPTPTDRWASLSYTPPKDWVSDTRSHLALHQYFSHCMVH